MSFERYLENAWLRREPTSTREIADQLGIAKRCLQDAAVDAISDDLRFFTAFNALLALATAALRANGYRMAVQSGHHTRLVETLAFSVGADDRLVRRILAFSRKRNAAGYDAAGTISPGELQEIRTTAADLFTLVEEYLRVRSERLRASAPELD